MHLDRFCVSMAGMFALLCATGEAQTTTRVSVGTGGTEGNAASTVGKVSADGRFVTFGSAATNLIAFDTNGFTDVFEHELASGTTALASVTAGGVQGNGTSWAGSISTDGRFTVFTSDAANLVTGDTFGNADVFVRDRVGGAITRVSVTTAGVQSDGDCGASASASAISADGRFVVFASDSFNLAPNDFNCFTDLFVHDRQAGTTTLVSVALDGNPGDGLSTGPSISDDGRYVVFASEATNLVTGPTPSVMNVYVRDLQAGVTTLVAGGFYSSISPDGRYVTFVSSIGLDFQIFLHDLQNGTTTLVSAGPGGVPGNDHSGYYIPSVSTGGRYVAFGSAATNLVPGDTNGQIDVFVHDTVTGANARVSVAAGGQEGDGDSYYPSISADGRFVTFESLASNLVPADTNGVADVFVHDRGAAFAFTSFCAGDGSGTACPCGNSGSAGNGCASSINAAGANLTASGVPSIAGDTVVLAGSGMPNSSALYFQGTTQLNGGQGAVFGDGLRCAGGSIIRLGTATNSAGASQYPEAGDPPVSVKGAVSAGNVRTYQCWYRNAAAFCQTATFNLTNGLQATWQP